MQGGTLRHRITIQSPTSGTDPFNAGQQGSWTDVLTCWSRIESAGSKAVWRNATQSMQVSHVITIRYPGANYHVGAGYQAVFGTRVFSILKGIENEDERNRQLQLFAWEIDPLQGGATRNG